MERPDEDKFSSDSEDHLSGDKAKRKADEDHRRSSSSDHQLTEEETVRKQDEAKRRTSSEPHLSEDESHIGRRHFIPISKRKSSSRIAADKIKKRVMHRKKENTRKGYGLLEDYGEETPSSSSSVPRARQGRSRRDDEYESAEYNIEPTRVEVYETKRTRKRPTSPTTDDEEEPKKGKSEPAGECNCGNKCRCKRCVCGKGMKDQKKKSKKDS